MGCKDFPSKDSVTGQDCPHELNSVSEHSPGIVTDDEDLVRAVFSPIHINEVTGELDPSAFSDVKDKGLSTDRESHTTRESIVNRANNKVEEDKASGKTDRELVGFVKACCADIRSIVDEENERCFCVYDTGLADNSAHSDTCQSEKHSSSRSSGKKFRKRLKDKFSISPLSPESYLANT